VANLLSLCMIVKNEEARLTACLASVQGVADEIVVVDTGSTDATPLIAACHGARVVPFDFSRTDFAAARNAGLAMARGEWILVLDADEMLLPASAPRIHELVTGNENAGYYFARHNSLASGEAITDYAVRLFPHRPDYRFRGRVHETVDDSILAGGGRLKTTDIRIDHNFSPDPAARALKNRRYIRILEEELADDPSDISRLGFLAAEYHQLGLLAEASAITEKIVEAAPHDPQAHLNAGIYRLIHHANPARARIAFLRALELKPGYSAAASFLHTLDGVRPDEGLMRV